MSKHDEWKVDDQEKMYNEIMYLQVNKFKESALYQEQKKKDTIYYANALSLVEGFDQVLKQILLNVFRPMAYSTGRL